MCAQCTEEPCGKDKWWTIENSPDIFLFCFLFCFRDNTKWKWWFSPAGPINAACQNFHFKFAIHYQIIYMKAFFYLKHQFKKLWHLVAAIYESRLMPSSHKLTVNYVKKMKYVFLDKVVANHTFFSWQLKDRTVI